MTAPKPNAQYPVTSTSVPSPMPNLIPDPSLKGASWDQILQNRGIRFVHKKAIPCPNMKSLDDSNHDPDCQFCDNSGLMFYDEREITGVFQSNSIEKTFEQHGIWEIGSAVVTLPTEYDNGDQAEFNTYDELVIPDFTVRLWELKEYEPRPGGIQKLRYPIKKMDYLASIVNGVLKVYQEGVDFNITTDGTIQWLIAPAYDATNSIGQVFTASYFANPVYKVLQPLRELRVSQEMVNGQKIAKRLPQQILVRRDFFVSQSEAIVNKR